MSVYGPNACILPSSPLCYLDGLPLSYKHVVVPVSDLVVLIHDHTSKRAFANSHYLAINLLTGMIPASKSTSVACFAPLT